MKILQDSHVDHDFTVGQLDFIKKKFADRTAFFKETFELPEEFGTVPCSLVGPAVGMPAIRQDEVEHKPRNGRAWPSRMWLGTMNGRAFIRAHWPLYDAPKKPQVRMVTVIAGPHEEKCKTCQGTGMLRPMPGLGIHHMYLVDCDMCNGTKVTKHACVLYTAYGGPAAPREPGDPAITTETELLDSQEFWALHALIE